MLPNNLTTNEVKNSAGTEVEFLRIGTVDRSVSFAQSGETPNAPHRIKVSHLESGSGADLVRRSSTRVDKTILGVSGKPRVISFYTVAVVPVGDINSTSEVANVAAELNSFMASTGATTTILFDGTGNGTAALISGTL